MTATMIEDRETATVEISAAVASRKPKNVFNPQAGERVIRIIPLRDITTTHNPRAAARRLRDALVAEGYVEDVDGDPRPWSVMRLAHELGLSDDPLQRAKFVDLMDRYEFVGPTKDGDPTAQRYQGIVNLAISRRADDIQPIIVRRIGNERNQRRTYGVAAGERRFLAGVYNWAKYGELDTISAEVRHKMTLAEAWDLAVRENKDRQDPTPVEEGYMYEKYLQETNPATGCRWRLKEVAVHLGEDYQHVRGRHALTYLPENEQRNVESGHYRLTEAIRKGMALKRGRAEATDRTISPKKETRRKVLTMAQIEAHFDASRPCEPPDYLRALAYCMQITLEDAERESDERIRQEIDAAERANERSPAE